MNFSRNNICSYCFAVWVVGLFLLLTSCDYDYKNVTQEKSAEVFYKKDMVFTVNDVIAEGVYVASKRSQFNFHIKARGDIDLFRLLSCHMDAIKEKAWNVKKEVDSGIFGWGSKKIDSKNEVKFTYKPREIEKYDCPIILKALEIKQNRHSEALVDFENDKYKLESNLYCNGDFRVINGVGICQSRMELIQVLEFKEDVIPAKSNTCGLLPRKAKKFKVKMPRGKCIVLFSNKAGDTQRMTFYGYEQILIRKLNDKDKK